MFIVAGKARVLSAEQQLDGRMVSRGDAVFFEKNVAHGFEASEEGLVFVSRNGGIVDARGNWDLNFG
jgi:quercetin dioxygenase-like cupin family protein